MIESPKFDPEHAKTP